MSHCLKTKHLHAEDQFHLTNIPIYVAFNVLVLFEWFDSLPCAKSMTRTFWDNDKLTYNIGTWASVIISLSPIMLTFCQKYDKCAGQ